MASAQKCPRKVCNKCKLELSDRHYRRHVTYCTFNNFLSIDHEKSTLIQNEKVQLPVHSSDSDTNLNFPSENNSITYENYVSKRSHHDQLNNICDNIDDDDAKAFFYINLEMTDESFDSSEYDSIVLSSTDEEENDVVSVDECSNFLTQLICTILILWQSIYFISDAAVESLLKLCSTVFQFLCKYSLRLETLVRVFPKNVYAMSKYKDSKKNSIFKVCCM